MEQDKDALTALTNKKLNGNGQPRLGDGKNFSSGQDA